MMLAIQGAGRPVPARSRGHTATASDAAHRAMVVVLGVFAIACTERTTGPDSRGHPLAAFAWKSAGAGTYDSCAISASGDAYCWGFDLVDQCGQYACVDSVPALVPGGLTFVSVTSGGGMHCGITPSAEAYCWGDMSWASLGDGATRTSATPVRVSIPAPVRMVSAGYDQACAITTDDVAYCWGHAIDESLGLGILQSAPPQPVATSLRFTSISVGTTQTCAVAVDASGYCWGGGYGTLGIGARDTTCAQVDSCLTSAVPLLVDGGLRWSSISAGNGFTCGLTIDQHGYCWGAIPVPWDPGPPLGVLGTGQFAGSKSPVPVTGGFSFTSITTGTRQACGITMTGAAYCWGNNEMAELGIGTTGGRFAAPQPVKGGLRFSAITLADHSCGLATDGTLYCWGTNYGAALGIGSTEPPFEPLPTRVTSPRQ